MKNKILPSFLLVFIFTISLNAATFVVNSTHVGVDANIGDNVCQTATMGECTLRAAIAEANFAAGIDAINFSIPGAGVKTIAPNSVLPDITQPLTIDGYTQPGSTHVIGILSSTASAAFHLEFFDSPTADPSGSGEGQFFVGAINVTTDGGGNASFGYYRFAEVSAGEIYVLTARHKSYNFAAHVVSVNEALEELNFFALRDF